MKNSNITLEFTTLPTNLIKYFQNSSHIKSHKINYIDYTINFTTYAPYLTIQYIHNNFLNILSSE